jgi:hypothetical protein
MSAVAVGGSVVGVDGIVVGVDGSVVEVGTTFSGEASSCIEPEAA